MPKKPAKKVTKTPYESLEEQMKDPSSNTARVGVTFEEPIAPLSLDLGRMDLNALVDKVNEIIKKVNK